MIRDMELMRKILFKIEKEYKPGEGSMQGPEIDGYDMRTIAEHCDLLEQEGFIKNYQPTFADDGIWLFSIGNVTNAGYDYLELIRNEDVWQKTTAEIEQQKAPRTIETITRIAA